MAVKRYKIGDRCNGGTIVEYTDQSARFIVKCDDCGGLSKRQASVKSCPHCYKAKRQKYNVGDVVGNGNVILSVINGDKSPYTVSCGTCGKEVKKYPSTIGLPCSDCRVRSLRGEISGDQLKKIRVYKGSAKRRGYSWSLSNEKAVGLFSGNCEYCGQVGPNGIDRLDNTVGYEDGNVVSCCSTCNYAKKDMTMEKWTAWLDRVAGFRRG